MTNFLTTGNRKGTEMYFGQILNIPYFVSISIGNQSDRNTFFTCPTRSSTSVSIKRKFIGNIHVNYVRQTTYIETSCSNIGSHKNTKRTIPEFIHDFFTLLLIHVTMKCPGSITVFHQVICNILCIHPGTTKDKSINRRIKIQ